MTCPPQQLIHDLGRSWMLALITSLLEHSHGFSELANKYPISNKVLTQRLTLLQEHKLVTKEEYHDGVQQRSRYLVTQKMRELAEIIDAYKAFQVKYHAELECGEKTCDNCPHLLRLE